MSPKRGEKLRGDKIRDLIFWVNLNNKWGKDKNRIPWLKDRLGYSTGGIYDALDNSGYFERTANEIHLTEKGTEYFKNNILPQFSAFDPIWLFLTVMGFFTLLQWYFWTYAQTPLIIPWYSSLLVIAVGLVFRFFFLRIVYLVNTKFSRKPPVEETPD